MRCGEARGQAAHGGVFRRSPFLALATPRLHPANVLCGPAGMVHAVLQKTGVSKASALAALLGRLNLWG